MVFIMLYNLGQFFRLWTDESSNVIVQLKGFKTVDEMFETVDEILKCDHSDAITKLFPLCCLYGRTRYINNQQFQNVT